MLKNRIINLISNAIKYSGGTGLGLNIVARYVELLHGKIEFKSEMNKGTSFVLTFPQPT